MNDNHDKEKNNLSKIIDELKEKSESRDRAHEEKVNVLKVGFNDAIPGHLKEIDDLKARIEINITRSNEEKLELRNEFEEKKKELANEINQLGWKKINNALTHQKELEELSTSHKDNTAVMNRKHKDQISGLLHEIKTLKTNVDNDAAVNDKCYDKLKTKLEQKIIDLVALHKEEQSETKAILEEKITKLTNSYEKECIIHK